MLKLPESEAECKDLSIMFATASGMVRRNSLMDFVNVQSNGKIAMKLDEGDKLMNVRICHEDNDVMLATKAENVSVSRLPKCASSSAAIRSAYAASGWLTATR